MKNETKVNDLKKLIQLEETCKVAQSLENKARASFDESIKKRSFSFQFNTELYSQAARAWEEYDSAEKAFSKLPKIRRGFAERVANCALYLGKIAAKMGDYFSGETDFTVMWGSEATAFTTTYLGDQYSRRCKYSKTNAKHVITLAPSRVHCLLANGELVEKSRCEGLPLIALDADGACTWVISSRKKIKSVNGWIIGDQDCVFHSTKSRDHAVKGFEKKKALWLKQREEENIRQKLWKKSVRRETLIAKLCHNAIATIDDAKAMGYCDPGIKAFQSKFNIGNSASLPALMKTGNPQARALALSIARKLKHDDRESLKLAKMTA